MTAQPIGTDILDKGQLVKLTERLGLGWRLHGDGSAPRPGAAVMPDERLSWPRTLGFGAQHVVAMFGATFVFPVVSDVQGTGFITQSDDFRVHRGYRGGMTHVYSSSETYVATSLTRDSHRVPALSPAKG